MSIILNLRDGKLIIPKDYYKRYLEFEWFFSKMIEFKKNDNDDDEYTLWEDKNALLSIFDSLKYSKLVVHKDVSLEYLISLCDMWVVPDWITKSVLDRKRKESEMYDSTKEHNKIYMCTNCKVGFKLHENENDSCKFHSMSVCLSNGRYYCCGTSMQSVRTFCRVGYHVPM